MTNWEVSSWSSLVAFVVGWFLFLNCSMRVWASVCSSAICVCLRLTSMGSVSSSDTALYLDVGPSSFCMRPLFSSECTIWYRCSLRIPVVFARDPIWDAPVRMNARYALASEAVSPSCIRSAMSFSWGGSCVVFVSLRFSAGSGFWRLCGMCVFSIFEFFVEKAGWFCGAACSGLFFVLGFDFGLFRVF